MEVRPGYKQTGIGVLPGDWQVEALGPLVSITSGESPSGFQFWDDGTPYFKVEQLNNTKKYLSETPYYFRGEQSVPVGSVIFPKRGASIRLNKVRILKEASFMDTNLMALTPKAPLSSEYLHYALLHIELWRIADTTSIPQINNKHITPLLVPLPPTKAEQEAIAGALSDADALIESLDALIVKKRQIKQGAMQELLTGNTRLPGFSGEWEGRKLGTLGSFLKGRGVSKGEALSGNLPCVRYGELYTKHNDHIRAFYSWISDEVAQCATRLHEGDILFAGSGETKEEIGKCASLAIEAEAYAGGDIVILRTKQGDPAFLGYYLNTEPVIRQKASRGQGDAVVHISATALADLDITIPLELEQSAIAAILSDMDAEIAVLETKLAKVRQIKGGMMQELLTGRIRLISGELKMENGE